jgi:hypothetical protein
MEAESISKQFPGKHGASSADQGDLWHCFQSTLPMFAQIVKPNGLGNCRSSLVKFGAIRPTITKPICAKLLKCFAK